MESIWRKTAQLPAFPRLEGERQTDVLIIGGGMAGLLCAYLLREAGVDCLLAEADVIAGGVTQNTTAKLSCQHGLFAHKLLRRFGPERARLYLDAHRQALAQYRTICRWLDCDFSEQDSFIYSRRGRKRLEQELTALQSLGQPASLTEELPLPFPTDGAVCLPGQAQFHPLKFLAGIVTGLPIYEHSAVRELADGLARTDHAVIRAEAIIVTTHFPFLNKHGSYFLKLYQHRSYVLALENAPLPKGMYLDENPSGLSLRTWRDTLLLGGGGHRTGKSGGGWDELERFTHSVWPQAGILCRWAAQDCMPLDDVPYIGPYSARTPDLLVATGLRKWGMTGSMAAALLLRDRILGNANPCAEVFSPSRSILRPQLAVNGAEAVLHLLTPTAPRCPHLGCALKWNRQEHTWDCPCHGSRFSGEGARLDGPATGDLPHPPRKM